MTSRYALAAVLIGLGLWIACPPFWKPYNRNLDGNPDMETLQSQCEAGPSKTPIRLYEGEGTLTAFWNSITVATAKYGERQWFYSYSEPSVKSIQCKGTQVEIYGEKGLLQSVPLQEITEKLVFAPVMYSHGQRDDAQWDGKQGYLFYDPVFVYVGAVPFALGLLLLWLTRRKSRKVALAESIQSTHS